MYVNPALNVCGSRGQRSVGCCHQSRREKPPISAAAARASKSHSQPYGDPLRCSHPRTGDTGQEELCVNSRSLSLWVPLRGTDSALMRSARDKGQKPARLPSQGLAENQPLSYRCHLPANLRWYRDWEQRGQGKMAMKEATLG